MSRALSELEAVLRQIHAAHRKLLEQLDGQQAGMKTMNLKAMAESAAQQELLRARLMSMDAQRRALAAQLAREMRIEGEVTLSKLAKLNPAQASSLLQLRRDLRETIEAIRLRTKIGSRLAGAVLGHLNTVMRLFAAAVQKGSVYTKHGTPNLTGRIGVMETVG
jgi:hypothetical protein